MQLEIGEIYDGTVSGMTDFGVFVTLENGKTGMVHISEVSNTYVKTIKDVISEGQEVKVKLLSINDNGKISFSIKQAMPKPEPSKKPYKPKSQKKSSGTVWQGRKKDEQKGDLSFEDMMAKFKQVSDEKMSDLKRSKESKQGTNFSRKNR